MTVDVFSAPPSVFPRLEPLLPRVTKPIQYVGGELNAVSKDWNSGRCELARGAPPG